MLLQYTLLPQKTIQQIHFFLTVFFVGAMFFLFLPSTAAQSTPNNDCSLAQLSRLSLQQNNSSSLNLENYDYFQKLNTQGHRPPQAIELALENLSTYCCFETKEIPNFLCTNVSRDTQSIPHSPFLFDHLVDVGMRRLDGDADNIYGAIELLDEQGKEWREVIREDATKIEGNPGAIIYDDHYLAARGKDHAKGLYKFTAWDNDNACDFFTEHSAQDLNLTDKYTMQCDIALCSYRELTQKNAFGTEGYDYLINDITYKLENGYKNCKEMVHHRILDELDYVQATIVSQGNQFLLHHTQKHTNTYFVGSRLNRLLTKWMKQLTWWEIVNRKVVEGTKQCSL